MLTDMPDPTSLEAVSSVQTPVKVSRGALSLMTAATVRAASGNTQAVVQMPVKEIQGNSS